MGIDLGRERVPDATTLLKFRRLLEKHKLGEALFAKVGEVLQAQGLKLGTGTIVDATIIGAPSSTKNADKNRDPEIRQTRKGQQWYFGMKLHIGVDSTTGQAQRRGHRSQRTRQAPAAAVAARPGGAVLWRLCLCFAAGVDPLQGSECTRPELVTRAVGRALSITLHHALLRQHDPNRAGESNSIEPDGQHASPP